MNSGATAMVERFGKLWKALRCGNFSRRGGVSYFNFVIHCEKIYDGAIYGKLLDFARDFHTLTRRKIAICVATPFCPIVSRELSGSAGDLFGERVLELKEHAQIGYHGHFYRVEGDKLLQISGENYDGDIVARQMQGEISWFKGLGISPEIYVAGWWLLTEGIVTELERSGISIDLSVRKGKSNTFGTKYLEDRDIPEYGKPFILPPSKSIIEIQSLFGPVMPPLAMRYHLSQYLCDAPEGDLFFAFPLHDWDIPKYYSNIISNIKMLKRSEGSIGWMDIPDMRKAYLAKNYGAGISALR